MDKNLIYTVTICAAIFGADETLLKVDIGNEFRFRRMSLIPCIDHLDKIFDTNAMELRQDYETARIDETLNIICIFKTYTIRLDSKEVEKYYEKLCDDVLIYLDDSIRAIRLFTEGPVRFKKLSIKMESEAIHMSQTNFSNNFSNIITIGEAMNTNTISKFHCNDNEIYDICKNISLIKIPLPVGILNNCHRYYDLSYHQDNFISITLLITCLEILFLNSENGKKEKLAKRCSVFLNDSKNERLNYYNKLCKLYIKRCDFVHDGEYLHIDNQDILFLRECVRKSLVKCFNNQHSKKEIIQDLKKIIQNLDYWEQKNSN